MAQQQPNILFIMSDDHAAHAITAYGSRINKTPSIDRIAAQGVRLDNCHCTNSICTPSRATILTGQYGHITGVREWQALDSRRPAQLQKQLKAAGYATAIFGKWHLGHGLTNNVDQVNNNGPNAVPADPAGFDDWALLPGHGRYHDPDLLTPSGRIETKGYISDLITDFSLEWLRNKRDASKPFFLCVHHKAPHRSWEPGERYKHLYQDEEIPLPETFDDDYKGRPAAALAKMRVSGDLNERDLKGATPPPELKGTALKNWYYQHYIKDYLRCVASCDASVGRLLDYLDEARLAENTIVIYTSDQGFFLGDHGWYDKRFIYEHSLRMPFVMRYPKEIPAGSVRDDIFTNLDFAPTLLDYAGVKAPEEMQGVSGRAMLRGQAPADWQTSFYYRYWDHGGHNVCAHYGVRTKTHKLVYFFTPATPSMHGKLEPTVAPYWELYDLERDPNELHNVYGDPNYAGVQKQLHTELDRLQKKYADVRLH
ncbi:sulfatase [bacterium]|nr:sulfatase [bacterium]